MTIPMFDRMMSAIALNLIALGIYTEQAHIGVAALIASAIAIVKINTDEAN